jgi:hypothetical protein
VEEKLTSPWDDANEDRTRYPAAVVPPTLLFGYPAYVYHKYLSN